MREVLGDAEPHDDAFRSLDDHSQRHDQSERYDQSARYGRAARYDRDDDFQAEPTEPGWLLRALYSIATPEALAIAGALIATASLLTMSAAEAASNALAAAHLFGSVIGQRAEALGELIAACVGGALAMLARRDRGTEASRWVRHVSGAAILVAMASIAFSIMALLVVANAHPQSPFDGIAPDLPSADLPSAPAVIPQVVITAPGG